MSAQSRNADVNAMLLQVNRGKQIERENGDNSSKVLLDPSQEQFAVSS